MTLTETESEAIGYRRRYKGRRAGMNWVKEEMAEVTNLNKIKGGLSEAIKTGQARVLVDPATIAANVRHFIYEERD
jgi:hypothetical protein